MNWDLLDGEDPRITRGAPKAEGEMGFIGALAVSGLLW